MIETLREKPILAEDSSIILRNLKESDRAGYFQTLRSVSPFPELYDIEGFEDALWEKTMSDPHVLVLAAERKSDGAYVGHGMVKWRTEAGGTAAGEWSPVTAGSEPAVRPLTLEVGMDVRAEFQGRGIGTEILTMMLRELRERFREAEIFAKTYSDNHRCRHVLQRLGGISVGREPAELEALRQIRAMLRKEGSEEAGGKAGAEMPGNTAEAPEVDWKGPDGEELYIEVYEMK